MLSSKSHAIRNKISLRNPAVQTEFFVFNWYHFHVYIPNINIHWKGEHFVCQPTVSTSSPHHHRHHHHHSQFTIKTINAANAWQIHSFSFFQVAEHRNLVLFEVVVYTLANIMGNGHVAWVHDVLRDTLSAIKIPINELYAVSLVFFFFFFRIFIYCACLCNGKKAAKHYHSVDFVCAVQLNVLAVVRCSPVKFKSIENCWYIAL